MAGGAERLPGGVTPTGITVIGADSSRVRRAPSYPCLRPQPRAQASTIITPDVVAIPDRSDNLELCLHLPEVRSAFVD